MSLSSQHLSNMLRHLRQHARKAMKKTEKKKVTQPAIASAQKAAVNREKVKRDVRARQLKMMRPHLKEEFKAAYAKLQRSNKVLDHYTHQLETVLDALCADIDNALTYTKEDEDKASKTYDFYYRHRQLILSGFGHLTGAQLRALEEELKEQSGEKLYHLSKSFNGNDVRQRIQDIMPPHEVTYVLRYGRPDETGINPNSLYIRFRGPTDRHQVPQISINPHSHRFETKMHKLDEEHFKQVLTDLGIWLYNTAPTRYDAISTLLDEMHQKALERERHMAIYGHARYTQAERRDTFTRMQELEERLQFLQKRYEIPAQDKNVKAPQTP